MKSGLVTAALSNFSKKDRLDQVEFAPNVIREKYLTQVVSSKEIGDEADINLVKPSLKLHSQPNKNFVKMEHPPLEGGNAWLPDRLCVGKMPVIALFYKPH